MKSTKLLFIALILSFIVLPSCHKKYKDGGLEFRIKHKLTKHPWHLLYSFDTKVPSLPSDKLKTLRFTDEDWIIFNHNKIGTYTVKNEMIKVTLTDNEYLPMFYYEESYLYITKLTQDRLTIAVQGNLGSDFTKENIYYEK